MLMSKRLRTQNKYYYVFTSFNYQILVFINFVF